MKNYGYASKFKRSICAITPLKEHLSASPSNNCQ